MKKKLTAGRVNSLPTREERYRVWDTEIAGFHVRVSPEGRKAYAFAYRHAGQPKEYTIGVNGTITAECARVIAKKLAGRVADGVDIQVEKGVAKAKAEGDKYKTLKDFVERKYKPWALSELKTGSDSLRTLSVDFIELYPKKLVDITPWVIQLWTRSARERGLRASTINRRITVIKSVLSKAVEWGVIEASPLRGLKKQNVDSAKKVRYLSHEEEARLRVTLESRERTQREKRLQHNKWLLERERAPMPELVDEYTDFLKPLVLVALNTGMRRGELFNLQWKDVDLNNALLTVEGEVSGSKSETTRHIPLSNEALRVLQAWKIQAPKNDIVFPSPKSGGRLDNIKTSWGNLIRDSKITAFRFHDLRHTFASNLVMGGVDLNTLRELLGHKTIEMTLRYAHLAPEHKAAAVAVLNARSQPSLLAANRAIL